jgi:hypothetical protein
MARAITRDVRCTARTASNWRSRMSSLACSSCRLVRPGREIGMSCHKSCCRRQALRSRRKQPISVAFISVRTTSRRYFRPVKSRRFRHCGVPNVGVGRVTGRHYERRRRPKFLGFMSLVAKRHERKTVHVTFNNPCTHAPKRDPWLTRYPNVHFHRQPTHASRRIQVEFRFSIASDKSLDGKPALCMTGENL